MLSTDAWAMVHPTPAITVARLVLPLAPATLTETRPAPGASPSYWPPEDGAVAGDETRHERAVTVLIVPGVVATAQVDPVDQAPCEVGQWADPRVEHRHVDALARVTLGPQLRRPRLLGEDGGRCAPRRPPHGTLDLHRQVGRDSDARHGGQRRGLRLAQLGRGGADGRKVGIG